MHAVTLYMFSHKLKSLDRTLLTYPYSKYHVHHATIEQKYVSDYNKNVLSQELNLL